MTVPEGLEGSLPETAGRDLLDAVVIRTAFGDDEPWNAVVGELRRPWGPSSDGPAAGVLVVDAPAWSEATADEVLAAVGGDEYLDVVFLADRHTMESPAHALPALTTIREDEDHLDPVHHRELVESPEPREFRAAPAAVYAVHVHVALGNTGFAELAAAASAEPDRVLRRPRARQPGTAALIRPVHRPAGAAPALPAPVRQPREVVRGKRSSAAPGRAATSATRRTRP
ncbi:hypothetical protein AB0E11_08535 [Streptomyces fradiae]|uniref:DUF6924 domain-containing protein n=1 Tax=Streptomyces fradiae TaxID=1906 RepID=UPI0033F6CAAA